MEAIEQLDLLSEKLVLFQKAGKSIGFVPTMGFLHQGHLSLIAASKAENDLTVCSIFVNPTQFNNPQDLEKYPRNTKHDLEMLEQAACDLVFLPSVEAIYPEKAVATSYDFGILSTVMEGQYRPGHFDGVATVVKRFFDIIKPNKAYFGEKDRQQLAVVSKLVQLEQLPIQVIGCPTSREADGLAMSSRNERLSEQERKAAALIPQTLHYTQQQAGKTSIEELKETIKKRFAENRLLRLEYFELVHPDTFENIHHWEDTHHPAACIAAYAGEVRLIDNMLLEII